MMLLKLLLVTVLIIITGFLIRVPDDSTPYPDDVANVVAAH